MHARQRELGRTVVECRGLPGARRVARLAPMVQKSSHVVRICRPLVVRLMAWIAVRIYQLVVVVEMAQRTLGRRV
jgi:hypothetical protein